jgi:hypothetical protein
MKGVIIMKDCSECANYETVSCPCRQKKKPALDIRKHLIKELNYDCFITEEDKMLCEIMCGD